MTEIINFIKLYFQIGCNTEVEVSLNQNSSLDWLMDYYNVKIKINKKVYRFEWEGVESVKEMQKILDVVLFEKSAKEKFNN